MKKIIASLSISLLMLIAFVSCSNTSRAEKSSSEKGKETAVNSSSKDKNLIKHIDLEFMKANIYNWEESPGEFKYKGSKPAIIDFYAHWCGPCRNLAPKIEAIAQKYEGKIDVYKVNVDDETTLAQVFEVKSIPMVLFIPMKGIPIQTLGDLPMDEIEKTISKILD